MASIAVAGAVSLKPPETKTSLASTAPPRGLSRPYGGGRGGGIGLASMLLHDRMKSVFVFCTPRDGIFCVGVGGFMSAVPVAVSNPRPGHHGNDGPFAHRHSDPKRQPATTFQDTLLVYLDGRVNLPREPQARVESDASRKGREADREQRHVSKV